MYLTVINCYNDVKFKKKFASQKNGTNRVWTINNFHDILDLYLIVVGVKSHCSQGVLLLRHRCLLDWHQLTRRIQRSVAFITTD